MNKNNTKSQIAKYFVLMLPFFLLASCISIVKRPAVNNVKSVALASISSYKTLKDKKTNQRISMDEEIIKYVKNIVDKSPDIIVAELKNLKGMTVKEPNSFIKTSEYQSFAASVKKLWSNTAGFEGSISPYNNEMPIIPGLVFGRSDEKKATNEEIKKLCNSLGVDAVAIIDVTYYEKRLMRLVGSSAIVPIVILSIRVVNKNGEEAINSAYNEKESEKELKATLILNLLKSIDENPEQAYLDTLKAAMKQAVDKINKEL